MYALFFLSVSSFSVHILMSLHFIKIPKTSKRHHHVSENMDNGPSTQAAILSVEVWDLVMDWLLSYCFHGMQFASCCIYGFGLWYRMHGWCLNFNTCRAEGLMWRSSILRILLQIIFKQLFRQYYQFMIRYITGSKENDNFEHHIVIVHWFS